MNNETIQLGNVHIAKIKENKKLEKIYTFEYDDNKTYSIFISKKKKDISIDRKFSIVDYLYMNPYEIYLNLTHSNKIKVVKLNRENVTIRNGNINSFTFKRDANKFKADSYRQLNSFINETLYDNHIIEIEVKSSYKSNNTKLKSVYYIITKNYKEALNIFTQIHFALYYCREQLINYINEYIFNLIFSMTHLPNRSLLNFLKKICIAIKESSHRYNLVFPLKKKIDQLFDIAILSKLHFLLYSLNKTKKSKTSDYNFNKFIEISNHYDNFNYEAEFVHYKKKDMSYDFINELLYNKDKIELILPSSLLKSSLSSSESENKSKSKISSNLSISKKDLKSFSKKVKFINPDRVHNVKMLKFLFNEITKLFAQCIEDFEENGNQHLHNFLVPLINKHLSMIISTKGFFNIDIVMHESNDVYGKTQKKIFNLFNKIFHINEGLFHMHFKINDFSYNFNDKNYAHIFPSVNDFIIQNQLRVFDIPFKQSWLNSISELLFDIYTNQFDLGVNKELSIDTSKSSIFSQTSNRIKEKFINLTNTITNEFFQEYNEVLPDYMNFCKIHSEMIKEEYNSFDNVCHHFTIKSISALLGKNRMFYAPIENLFKVSEQCGYGNKGEIIPNLNSTMEPFLFCCDKNAKEYFEYKDRKEKYITKYNITCDSFIHEIKEYKNTLLDIGTLYTENLSIDTVKEEGYKYKQMRIVKEDTNEIIQRKKYNFYLASTLSKHFEFELNQQIFTALKNYREKYELILDYPNEDDIVKNSKEDLRIQEMKSIIFLLKRIKSIHNSIDRLNLLFIDFVNKSSSKIENETNDNKNKNNYIKIGHYLINYIKYNK